MPIPERLFEEKPEELKVFCSVVKGENFMTPNVEDFIRVGKYVCELSSANTSFMGSFSVGVTVVNSETMEREWDLDNSFHEKNYKTSMQKAMEYISSLNL